MEFKGTKGKWVISTGVLTSDRLEHILITPKKQFKERNGYRSVCSISPLEHFDKEDHANALLISKAPEMLEMLKKCHQEFIKLAQKGQYPEGFLVCNGGNGLGEIEQLIKEATEI